MPSICVPLWCGPVAAKDNKAIMKPSISERSISVERRYDSELRLSVFITVTDTDALDPENANRLIRHASEFVANLSRRTDEFSPAADDEE